ncbi:MAG: hypothetical protein CK425_00200 [Parachlamydia sp.]|nr:MAG: hypothetical protein CK425_00200 [Parachlamydia sp.]
MTEKDIGFINRFFTGEHWSHPFTITKSSLPVEPINPIKISGSKKSIAIITALFTGIPTAGILSVPVFFLASSLMKSWEISQRKKAINLTETPGPHRAVPTPNPPPPSPHANLLPPPPPDGIKIGIRNLANTCWLNASMKFMSSTDFWDPILVMPTTTPMQAKLQNTLKTYITRMRTENKGYIGKKDAKILEAEVNKLIRDDPMIGGQMDAAEFFLCLQRVFQYPSAIDLNPNNPHKDFYQSTVVYKSNDPGYFHPPNADTADPLIKISVSYAEALGDMPLDPATLLKKRDTRTFKEDEKNEAAPEINYTTSDYPLNLPKTLHINFSRVVGVEDERGRQKFTEDGLMEQVRCNRPLALDRKGCFELIEYDRSNIGLNDSDNWVIRPTKKCTYQLTGAILHGGSDKDGHYTAIERTETGKFIHHNDRSVNEMDADEAINRCENNGVMLRFKRINDIQLSEEEVKEIIMNDSALW